MQSWSLNQKIDHACETIDVFLYETNNPVISFSGGRDSSILMHLIRNFMKKDVPVVFVNTGNEYPEIVKFVNTFKNTHVIRPKTNIKRIIEKYGFPLVSKEYSKMIYELRQGLKCSDRYLTGIQQDGKKTSYILPEKYRFLVNEKFSCSDRCCYFLKKQPTAKINNITAEMATESILRQSAWLVTGCNSFGKKHSKSKPFSIWTNTDINEYIRRFDVKICDIYNDERINRTGCMFCGFGAHLENISRFEVLRDRYPRVYDFFLNMENNGVSYITALNKIGVILPHQRGYQRNIFSQ